MHQTLSRLIRPATILLRKIPGMVLLLEVLRRYSGREHLEIVITDFDGDLTMSLRLHEHMESQIFWYGYYNRDIVALLNRVIKPGEIFFDIGANVGEITLASAKRTGQAGRVYAFEPTKESVIRLHRHVLMNRLNQVEVVAKGLADSPGQKEIYMDEKVGQDGLLNKGTVTMYKSEKSERIVGTVDVTTVDEFVDNNFINRIDGVKIDIEGSELSMLHGASRTLEKFRPWIICEVNRDACAAASYNQAEILHYLKKFNYQIYKIGRFGSLSPLSEEGLGRMQNIFACQPEVAPKNRTAV